jgi:hypothetical protein
VQAAAAPTRTQGPANPHGFPSVPCRSVVRAGGAGVCFLDVRLLPPQNVDVRGRLIAIVIALAVLAFADICYEQASASQPRSHGASGQLTDPPAPEPDVPAIVTAAVSTSATARTVFVDLIPPVAHRSGSWCVFA